MLTTLLSLFLLATSSPFCFGLIHDTQLWATTDIGRQIWATFSRLQDKTDKEAVSGGNSSYYMYKIKPEEKRHHQLCGSRSGMPSFRHTAIDRLTD